MKKIKPKDLEGFVYRSHQPYTDYNQEIVDWLKENAVFSESNLKDHYYIFSGEESFYNHRTIFSSDKYYSNEEFKEWIGMNNKVETVQTFTKADLKVGMVCTVRGGNVYVVASDRIIREDERYILLDDFNDDLTATDDLTNLDIISVQQTLLVFQREDKKKAAIEKELESAKAKAERLASHIAVLESKLK